MYVVVLSEAGVFCHDIKNLDAEEYLSEHYFLGEINYQCFEEKPEMVFKR
jgi:hypothetical protein